ncbi:thiol-disulfide isomerase/thioredoxin [Actinoplanes tereljensis]|uniref:redoxin domain-containing protein n=1 Tax=Paractinoplanes tereljensis TaxID=571912 RepID=UPI001EF1B532|nr:redoxin domain-containing protein [Actinoplanes tereljensis]
MTGSPQLPPLSGAGAWLNSRPLLPEELRGRVVLVNFWTLTCINWLRQEPYVRAWSQAYRHDGLLVIGVHTPEFSFEHDVAGVKRAVQEREIDYPVAVDSDYAIWSAFDNHYWPALYFADRDGALRDFHFGEGRYEESERRIQRLLGIHREPTAVRALGVEAPADWDHLRTPETYLGTARGERFASPGGARDGSHTYAPPGYLDFNDWALDGVWTVGRESVELDEAGGSIGFRFQARDAHVVLAPAGEDPIPFRLFVDGEPPGENHGADVDEQGHGVLGPGRLYQLFREREKVRERTLEITFAEPGARAYSFTFG